jgi:glycogen debranching enzyme
MLKLFLLLQFAVLALGLQAQSLSILAEFPFDHGPLTTHHTAQPQQPFTVVGEHAAILGSQDGSFELWLMPIQILRNARLTARLQDYDAPILLNGLATDVEVEPDQTTITYSHAAITVRQHMFLPRTVSPGVASAIVLFEVHATRPAEISLSFDPSMTMQWPAPNFGPPSVAWVERPGGSGYVLQTNNPGLYGVVAMPGATHGDLRPYQERAQETSATLKFSYDPKRDDHRFYPLLCGVAETGGLIPQTVPANAPHEEQAGVLLDHVLAVEDKIPALYRSTAEFYRHFFDDRFETTTPDPDFDRALRWAEIAVDQSRMPLPQGTGMTAGWLPSGPTARPGYGWFFGRDTLWSLYAVNSYGDFQLSRGALEFLLSQQRDDGKMMHELSQTAAAVDWHAMPYQYAAADATPLFLMAMDDYVRMSGDVEFLHAHWQEVLKAYGFTRSHTTCGAMDNSQGSGWVEEWLPHKPDQEIYLVAIDAQANLAVSRLAKIMGDIKLEADSQQTTQTLKAGLDSYRSSDGIYRFSRNRDGSFEDVRSIFPSVAWWSGDLHPAEADKTFADWESSHFTVDWGVRSVADDQAIYDPISYHRGSVWPLYTGWAAMAEYRAGRSLAAYEHLESSVRLTWLQDPGAITELLSGEFYQPLARSSSHQLWSSAMLLSPAIRGLFGLRPDALNHRLTVSPQLPANWDHVALRNVAVGSSRYGVTLDRKDSELVVDVSSDVATTLCLSATVADVPCRERPTQHHILRLPLPAVEVSVQQEAATLQGMRSQHMHVLNEQREAHFLILTLEAPGNSEQTFKIRRNEKAGSASSALQVEGGELRGDLLQIHAPLGEGYQKVKVTIRW